MRPCMVQGPSGDSCRAKCGTKTFLIMINQWRAMLTFAFFSPTLLRWKCILSLHSGGQYATKIKLRNYVWIGAVFSGIAFGLIGLFGKLNILNTELIFVFMFFNGFFQSTGWPGCIGILGNWFNKKKNGLLLGTKLLNRFLDWMH